MRFYKLTHLVESKRVSLYVFENRVEKFIIPAISIYNQPTYLLIELKVLSEGLGLCIYKRRKNMENNTPNRAERRAQSKNKSSKKLNITYGQFDAIVKSKTDEISANLALRYTVSVCEALEDEEISREQIHKIIKSMMSKFDEINTPGIVESKVKKWGNIFKAFEDEEVK